MKRNRLLTVLFSALVGLPWTGCGGGGNGAAPVPQQIDFTPANPRLGSAALLADLQYLADPAREGRKIGTPGNAQARDFLTQRFTQLGLETVGSGYQHPFTWHGAAGVNVVGRLTGSRHPERIILVSAHFDHVGIRNGAVYPGADDNASGSAAVLQLAGWLKAHPPANTVLFCLFDGEESGLYGSQAFVAAAPVDLGDIAVVLNLDMIAQGTQGRIFVGGTSYTASLKPHLTAAYAGSKVKVVPDFEVYDAQSDQYPFMQRGVPFLFFCVGNDDPWYHTPADTFERIPQAFYWASVEAILETFLRLDGLETLPKLLPHAPARPGIPGERALRPRPWIWSPR